LSEARKSHWQKVYTAKEHTEVSWFQPVPAKSLDLIRSTGAPLSAPILDVGAGASTLADHLLAEGYADISVLDIAAAAFEQARERLAAKADQIHWIESDVTEFEPSRRFSIWHDRAVFHFLTDAADRDRYLQVLRDALQPDGHFLLATFGPEGPLRCSGLEIERYSVERLQALLWTGFKLRHHEFDEHRTPTCGAQQFLYGWWQLSS
jgi:SAM-dependent methyltransferase